MSIHAAAGSVARTELGSPKTMQANRRNMSRQELRELDRRAFEECGIPTLLLMENAGRGAAELLDELVQSGHGPVEAHDAHGLRPPILIVCGPGNNGGDGAVVARHLDGWGYPTRTIWLASQRALTGDAATQARILERSRIAQEFLDDVESAVNLAHVEAALNQAEWLVDGVFGTGLSRPIAGLARQVIEHMNHSGKPILALDLPSGLDADTGHAPGIAVRAAATATFAAPKLGFQAPGSFAYTGQIAVIDLGLPRFLLDTEREAPQ